jgi:hypothetical protein
MEKKQESWNKQGSQGQMDAVDGRRGVLDLRKRVVSLCRVGTGGPVGQEVGDETVGSCCKRSQTALAVLGKQSI